MTTEIDGGRQALFLKDVIVEVDSVDATLLLRLGMVGEKYYKYGPRAENPKRIVNGSQNYKIWIKEIEEA